MYLPWRPGHKPALNDLTRMGELLHELHFLRHGAEQVRVEPQDPQGIVGQLAIDHFQVEIDAGRELPGILADGSPRIHWR